MAKLLVSYAAVDPLYDAKGDLIVGTGADAAGKLAIGADDLVLAAASSQTTGAQWKPRTPPSATHLPSGALAATFDRATSAGAAANALTSGTLYLAQINLAAGMLITSISFKSGGTALASGTHQFFGLFDINRVCLRWTGDDTSTAWAGTTVKTLNLTSTYTTTATGDYYIGLVVAATTVPTLQGQNAVTAQLGNIAPIITGNTSDTGLTTPPTLPFTAGAITSNTFIPYGFVS